MLVFLPPHFFIYPSLDYYSLYNFFSIYPIWNHLLLLSTPPSTYFLLICPLSTFFFLFSSIFYFPLICLLFTHLPFFSLFVLPYPVTKYIEVSLLSCAIAGAGEKQKRGGNGRSSLFLAKKTTTRSTRGQHSIFGTNIITAKLLQLFSSLFQVVCVARDSLPPQ